MSDLPLVVVTDYIADPDIERAILGPTVRVTALLADREARIVDEAPDAEVLLAFHEISIGRPALEFLPRLKGVIRCGVGFDNVDLKSAGALGIVVCNVPDYGTEEVADHALMLLLAVARRLLPCALAARQGTWDAMLARGAPRLRGRTIGLVGCGRIGTAVAVRAKALGLRVVFFDPYKPDGYEKSLGVERTDRLEALLTQSDFLSLHCPLTRETRHLLNRETLALLKPGAYVINTARGPCIEVEALVDALDAGTVAAAGLDVLECEPTNDERVLNHPRIVLTPHAAFYSVEAFGDIRKKSAAEARRMLTGEAVRNPVNLDWLSEPRCRVAPPRPPAVL